MRDPCTRTQTEMKLEVREKNMRIATMRWSLQRGLMVRNCRTKIVDFGFFFHLFLFFVYNGVCPTGLNESLEGEERKIVEGNCISGEEWLREIHGT